MGNLMYIKHLTKYMHCFVVMQHSLVYNQRAKGNPVTIPEPVEYTFALEYTGNGSTFVIMAT